jgi:hypothetical protein
MAAENPYSKTADESLETPLERAARTEVSRAAADSEDTQAEREADLVVGDVDEYVAQTDPASLPDAQAALDAWEIPNSPLEGVPDDVALNPGEEVEPLVSVFSAQNESEANIVRGLLESQGIAAIFREVATPAYGSIFSVSESRWADILVASTEAQAAREAIEAAVQSSNETEEVE